MLQLNETDFHLPLSEFSFERRFDDRGAIRWMQANWSKSFVFSALYAALVFGGQHYMKPRPKMNLRRPLVLWSLSLALFSIIGAVRTGSYMLHILSSSGFRRSICDQSFYSGPVSKFWAYAFVLSKAPELGDTAFIVLRKQKLLFLHWYHHITVLLYSWYSYKDMVAGGGWFMTMNYAVHALMYSYYAARAGGVRVPRPFAVLITSAQIAQMAMGLTVSGLVYGWMQQGDCPSRLDNITWAALMYLSYLLLFSNFFYQTYLRRHAADAKAHKTE
ncbi:elongation of very long chain fatty acids protein 6 [Lates calcarifer]|uniref:Elongation of very long chain fatty acids protein 6 n=1 Tax=Lates calcarifer TaxID=8187 RepID=A0A4W6F240_LATCA|nr:elongation of very long chain fatty acids protein 6 [Lates calcarifer]XP_018544658.1 elongation of very long chain fatty acids protein 6 [Lates calcarifer]XP_050923815.1 elongation of very long chain fatty acids protein 6 [Lates calcarifer]